MSDEASPQAERMSEAAYDLAEESGLAALSARSLARKTGMSPSAINYHIGNRERLIAQIAFKAIAVSSRWRQSQAALQEEGAPRWAELDHVFTSLLQDRLSTGRMVMALLQELENEAVASGQTAIEEELREELGQQAQAEGWFDDELINVVIPQRRVVLGPVRMTAVDANVAMVHRALAAGEATDVVHVDGERVPTAPGLVVVAMNKPRGVVTAMSDDRGRPCVGDMVADRPERLFHVGRLDAETEGLLLLTNDGELTNRLMHPSHEVAKTYRARIDGAISKQAMRALSTGIDLDDGPIACDSARVIQRLDDRSLVEVTLHSGRNRIVRRMFDAVGYPVLDLVRTSIGPISLGNLKPGEVDDVRGAQLRSLYTAVEL